MGVSVLILGKSGSGKSTSLRNFRKGEVGIFNVLGKPLPFRGELDRLDGAEYEDILSSLAANKLNAYVIDDSTYLMQNENFDRVNEKGYTKFTDMAANFRRLINASLHTSKDTITYFLHHCDENDEGKQHVKTIGKMLDNQYCVEGAFPIVINCEIQDGKHVFSIQPSALSLAKAPMGMLPEIMDNDLKAVDTKIREYWKLAPIGQNKKEK